MSAPERREQLLDVTRALAWERGFHRLSIEGVASAAGISRPIVYQHFGDLPGLLARRRRARGRAGHAQLAALLPTDLADDPREQLLGALRAFLEAVRGRAGPLAA